MTYLHWNVDPVLLNILGLKVRWYGIMFAIAFILGYRIMTWIYLREGKDISNIDRLLFFLVGGTLIGARLGHCLFYDPTYYLYNPLKILFAWEGGLASHGGGLGVLAALYLYKRKSGEAFLWLLDRVTVPTALAACFIRLGNFFNSEIIGIPTTVPWAVIFERIDFLPRHPAQLYEAISYLLTFIILIIIYKISFRFQNNGFLFGLFLILIFMSRVLVEFVKIRQAAYSNEFWLSTGQILSIPFIAVGVIIMIATVIKSK